MFKLAVVGLAAVVADEAANESRMKRIEEINAKTNLWNAAYGERFADGAMADLCGVPANNQVELDAAIARGEISMIHHDENLAIPDTFDSETNWPDCAEIIGDIRDQSNCGCCWAFGPASAASDRYCIATGDKTTLSAQDVCFCSSSNGCGGGFPHSAWTFIKSGVVTGGQYNNTLGPFQDLCSAFSLPHCHHHGPQGDDPFPPEGSPGCPSQRSPKCPKACDANAKAPHNDFATDQYSFTGTIASYSSEAAIQQAILTGGPVATAFTVYADFEDYVSGIYHHVTGTSVGGHAVRIVGWGVDGGVKYWKVANSWNPHWGEAGYFRIIRGTNEGGIESQAVASADNVVWKAPQ